MITRPNSPQYYDLTGVEWFKLFVLPNTMLFLTLSSDYSTFTKRLRDFLNASGLVHSQIAASPEQPLAQLPSDLAYSSLSC